MPSFSPPPPPLPSDGPKRTSLPPSLLRLDNLSIFPNAIYCGHQSPPGLGEEAIAGWEGVGERNRNGNCPTREKRKTCRQSYTRLIVPNCSMWRELRTLGTILGKEQGKTPALSSSNRTSKEEEEGEEGKIHAIVMAAPTKIAAHSLERS